MRISDWSSDVCSSDLHHRYTFDAGDLGRNGVHQQRTRVSRPPARHIQSRRINCPPPRAQPDASRIRAIAILRLLLFMISRNAFGREFQCVSKLVRKAVESSLSFSGRDSPAGRIERSEEHTSELQSLMRISYAVFCLTKKKKQ